MAAELGHPDLEDPFADCSALSLLPRTIGAHVRAAPSLLEAQEEDAIRNLFKSMALKGSKEFLEQAQRIKKSCSNFPSPHPEDGDKAFAANGKDRPQVRRPALGRKRAQFSLKPNSIHSVPKVDFDSGIDHIEDPEEYFLAFEQFENADKELKKLRGEVSTDPLQHQQSPTARKRRPGILRKTASYKHHFPAKVDIAEIFKESQEEISDKRTFSPSNTSTIAESSNILHPRTVDEPDISQFRKTNSEYLDATERQGSVTDKEKKVNDILDKLLTSFEDLDEGEGATLLRESLHIKSIDVGKMCLPEFHNVQKNHIGTLEGRVMRKELEGCQLSQNSSSLVRSRLAAFSTLQRRISLEDPYSVPPVDDAPIPGASSGSKGEHENSLSPPADIGHHERNGSVADDASSPVIVNGKRFSLVDQLDTPVSGADRTVDSKITTEEELTEYSPCLLENATEQSHNKVDNGKDASAGLDGHVEEEGHDMQLDALISNQPDAGAEGPTTGCKVPTGREDLPSPHCSSMPQNHSSSGIDVDANLHGPDDILQDEATIPAQEVVVGVGAFKDNSDLATTVLPMDVQSENERVIPEENNERQGLQEASGEPQKKEGRQKAPRDKHNRKKLTSRRQSLADAGMMWKSGVRRSTRIRSRPLQYWRGERFLYGRIHDSLATVIGVKCTSPGNPALKVKSFVSEEYSDLVAQAGLH